ncbi:conserved hypothetical protein [Candidatus Brocadia pituitae]|nr:conserved hypothetical protein [Candidatus Brocadia pituitae]
MKIAILKRLFRPCNQFFFLTMLISIFIISGFAYTKEASEPTPSPDSQASKETPTKEKDVVKPVPLQDYLIKIPSVERIEGIAWDEGKKNLFVLDGEKKKIDRINPISGQLLQSLVFDPVQLFVLDQKNLKGLAFDREAKVLWVAAEEKAKEKKAPILIMVDPVSGKTIKTIDMEIPEEKGFDSIEGITWDEKRKDLWVAIYAGFSSSFNQINPETGEIIRSVFADCYPRGIATDGENLWSICYNGEKFPSKIDKRKIQEKDYEMFHSRTFIEDIPEAKQPTSLVFDGTHLWYADRKTKSAIRFTPPVTAPDKTPVKK